MTQPKNNPLCKPAVTTAGLFCIRPREPWNKTLALPFAAAMAFCLSSDSHAQTANAVGPTAGNTPQVADPVAASTGVNAASQMHIDPGNGSLSRSILWVNPSANQTGLAQANPSKQPYLYTSPGVSAWVTRPVVLFDQEGTAVTPSLGAGMVYNLSNPYPMAALQPVDPSAYTDGTAPKDADGQTTGKTSPKNNQPVWVTPETPNPFDHRTADARRLLPSQNLPVGHEPVTGAWAQDQRANQAVRQAMLARQNRKILTLLQNVNNACTAARPPAPGSTSKSQTTP